MKATFNTKIPNSRPGLHPSEAIEYLEEYSEYFGMIERKLFVELLHKKTSLNTAKSSYIKLYNITARQFNAIHANLNGKIKSIRELKKTELLDKKDKIKELTKSLEYYINQKAEVFEKLRTLKMSDKSFKSIVSKYRYIKKKIHKINRLTQELRYKVNVIESDTKAKIVRICFGSKDFFKKQYNLEANKFKSHEDWLKIWKSKRSSQFMLIGSSDESFGNQNGQYQLDGTMKIKVAEKFVDKYGDYIYIPNISFKYGQEHIDKARETYRHTTKAGNKKIYCKGALTHRFFKNEYGWYLGTTVDVPEVDIVSDIRLGALGVDFNVNFAVATLTDRFGNPIKEFKLNYKMYGARSGQIDAHMGDIAKELCIIATKYRVPIVIEDLCFANAKKYTDKGTKYNRMINNFPYAKFRDSVQSRCYKAGIELIVVNPAYTSIIGQFKFMKKYGLSSHSAAACTIARKGQGYDMPRIEPFRKEAIKKMKPKLNMNQPNKNIWINLSKIVKKNFTFNDRIQMLYDGLI